MKLETPSAVPPRAVDRYPRLSRIIHHGEIKPRSADPVHPSLVQLFCTRPGNARSSSFWRCYHPYRDHIHLVFDPYCRCDTGKRKADAPQSDASSISTWSSGSQTTLKRYRQTVKCAPSRILTYRNAEDASEIRPNILPSSFHGSISSLCHPQFQLRHQYILLPPPYYNAGSVPSPKGQLSRHARSICTNTDYSPYSLISHLRSS